MQDPLLPPPIMPPESSTPPPTSRSTVTGDDADVPSDDESFGSNFDALEEADDPLGGDADPVPSDDEYFGSEFDRLLVTEADDPLDADPVPSDDDSYGSDFDALEADDIPDIPEDPPVYSRFAVSQPSKPQSSSSNVDRKLSKQEEASRAAYPRQGGMCVVCQERPAYSKGGKSYPTCGLKCAGVLEYAQNSYTPPSHSGGSPHAGPSAFRAGSYPNGASPYTNPPNHFSKNAPTYFDPSIERPLQHSRGHTPRRPRNLSNLHNFPSSSGSRNYLAGIAVSETLDQSLPAPTLICVICLVKPCRDSKYVTCSLTCAEKLCKGGSNSNNCDYCHRRPKVPGYSQCSPVCVDMAKLACLLCKSRPKFKQYHLCGRTCKQIATKSTPLILEAPPGHVTYEMVEDKFKSAWRYPEKPCPPIKRIYKIIESKSFLQPYERYKRSVRNEVFRYHGTTQKCTLGTPGCTTLCSNTGCSLCSILRTSFKTSLAKPSGAFGPGIYSSSASNKAYSFTGGAGGVMLLTKVVLGKVRQVTGWKEVKACPPGFNSVVFERLNGALNETVVYSDDAIRPVFLIVF